MIRNAKDLSPDQKIVLENLLGRRILADEDISVRAIERLLSLKSCGKSNPSN